MSFKSVFTRFMLSRTQSVVGEADKKGVKSDELFDNNLTAGGGNNFYFSSYQHGFTNGVLQIQPDEDSFFRFLQHQREIERLQEKRRSCGIEMEKLRNELSGKRLIQLDKRKAMISGKLHAEYSENQVARLQGKIEKVANKHAGLSEKREHIRPEYAWLPALFFLIAGLVFVGADIVVTRDITASGFDMAGVDGWLFSFGLAFTAFLIKPFLDRVYEKPFQQSGHLLRTSFRILLLMIVLAGIVMLFFLGSFRSDAKNIKAEINKNTEVIKTLEAAYPVDADKVNDARVRIERSVQNLSENPAGKTGLILSGILFAIGGGLCLSVAFPSLTALLNRYYFLPLRIGFLQTSKRMLNARLRRRMLELTKNRETVKLAETELELLSIPELEAQFKKSQEQEEATADQIYGEKALRDQLLYLDGKERGGKYRLEGDLTYKLRQSASELEDMDFSSRSGHVKRSTKYSRRPYVKLRKLLANSFIQSKNEDFYEDPDLDTSY